MADIPRFPKHIIEQLEPNLRAYLEEPCPGTAFYLGVECEYLGHFDPEVQYGARTVLACIVRDIADLLEPDQLQLLRALVDRVG